MPCFELIPRDVLFFRDARPMEASDAGRGAFWPRPDQLYNAIHNGFIAHWPKMQDWEGDEHTRGRAADKNQNSSFRFGALKTFGPFPCKNDKDEKGNGSQTLFLPCPLDWGMELVWCEGTDLPEPLKYAFLPKKEGKASFPEWITTGEYLQYLSGKEDAGLFLADRKPPYSKAKLFSADRNIGIAIDPNTGTTVEHQFYQAEYLRLATDVSMVYGAECVIKPKHGDGMVDVFGRADAPRSFVFGGQQGVCSAKEMRQFALPEQPEIAGKFVRWTLLSPAVFKAGWLPGWIDPKEGRVMLRQGEAIRQAGESRADWKKRQNALPGFTSAKLIAARIGKPIAFSGWDLQARAPKPTVLAVPAGSSYVFECESPDEAKALATALNHPNRRSDLFGEKGFGIGICSNPKFSEQH